MTAAPAAVQNDWSPRHRLAAALGWAAAGLLAASIALPYWQGRMFAPQYRDGLTVTMRVYAVTGDVAEIDELNHYIGMRRIEDLAVVERRLAPAAIVLLALLCGLAWSRPWERARRAVRWSAAALPAGFILDMAFWMRWATTHRDPTAPIALKAFSIPFLGVGRVAQFRSEFFPREGFYLALAAAALVFAADRIARRRPAAPPSVAAAGRLPKTAVLAAVLTALAALAAAVGAEPLQPMLDAAPEGAVLELPPGTYEGPAVVSKPLTLRGAGRAAIAAAGRGTVLKIAAPRVTLEGLVLRGSGESLLFEDAGVRVEAASFTMRGCRVEDVLFGAFLAHAPGAVLEDNLFRGKVLEIGRRGDLIRGWNSDRVVARRNRLEGGRDFVLWFSTGSRVEDNVVSGGRYGLHFMYTNGAVVSGNRFVDNSVGLYVMYSHDLRILGNRFERHRGPSGAGLGLKESEWLEVAGNDFVGNRQGLYLDGSPLVPEHANAFTRNVFARNDIGIAMLPGSAGNTFSENVFEDNLQQISRRGGGRDGNEWTKDGRGNFWSDYAGYGAPGSATGRRPYRVEGAWEGIMDRVPAARFLAFTPAAEAVDLASRAFPVFRPKAVLTDEAPLLRPPVDPRRSETPVRASPGLPAALLSLWGGLLSLPSLLRRRARALPPARPAGAAAVAFAGVRKRFGSRVILAGIDAEAAAGETLVLWGSNGAGKSTLIKCLLGLYEYEGSIRLFGRDARAEGPEARANVGYVAQEPVGYDWTVGESMEFVAALRGVEPSRIEGALARCGLAGERGKRVPDLSGGMKQKLALAQALLPDPPLLVLDEPCSNLDAASRKDLIRILRGLKGSRAILMTSHRSSEVEALADRVLWLEEGRAPRLLSTAEFSRAASAERAILVAA